MRTGLTQQDINIALKGKHIEDDLTIFCVRSESKIADKFDDVFALLHGNNIVVSGACTCDSGLDNLIKPVNNNGTAIVTNGFYPNLWKLGFHKGKYKALIQASKIAVFRDDNKDNILNYPDTHINDDILDKLIQHNGDMLISNIDEASIITSKITGNNLKDSVKVNTYRLQYGMFGINFHRASAWRKLVNVGLYSAGCTVVQEANVFDTLLEAVEDYVKTYNINRIHGYFTSEKSLINYK